MSFSLQKKGNMNKTVLIVDDDKVQAQNLYTALKKRLPQYDYIPSWEERDIMSKTLGLFIPLAIVDIRMDGFSIDGFQVMDQILEVNPFAKFIVVSAYLGEYQAKLSDYMQRGAILALSEKNEFAKWIPELVNLIEPFFKKNVNPIAVQFLEDMYADVKNDQDTYQKGVKFEEFVVMLFRQMGFVHIEKRVKDEAENEVDLIVRNDINDTFFGKYGRYIFVECKNKPDEGFSKNDFIVFNNKVQSSHGDCNLGMVFTTGHIKRTVYKEYLKEAKDQSRIIFLDSALILQLIHTPNMIEELKEIADKQVL